MGSSSSKRGLAASGGAPQPSKKKVGGGAAAPGLSPLTWRGGASSAGFGLSGEGSVRGVGVGGVEVGV